MNILPVLEGTRRKESCSIIKLSLSGQWSPMGPSGATSNEFLVQYPALIEIWTSHDSLTGSLWNWNWKYTLHCLYIKLCWERSWPRIALSFIFFKMATSTIIFTCSLSHIKSRKVLYLKTTHDISLLKKMTNFPHAMSVQSKVRSLDSLPIITQNSQYLSISWQTNYNFFLDDEGFKLN